MFQQRIESEFGHYAGRIIEGDVKVVGEIGKVEELVSYDPEDTEKE